MKIGFVMTKKWNGGKKSVLELPYKVDSVTNTFDKSPHRETWDEHSFVDAVNDCIGRDYDGTPFTGLMPVGKLRNFKNYYEYNTTMDHDKMTWFCWGRYFRVNGIKDKRGVWREFPSGSPVIFSHFPEFQQNHGHSGESSSSMVSASNN